MSSKESGKVRYAYGVAMALLLGGTAFSIAGGPVGAEFRANPSVLYADDTSTRLPRTVEIEPRPFASKFAAAEYLVKHGYTKPQRLGIRLAEVEEAPTSRPVDRVRGAQLVTLVVGGAVHQVAVEQQQVAGLVADFTPELAAGISGIPADTIRRIARGMCGSGRNTRASVVVCRRVFSGSHRWMCGSTIPSGHGCVMSSPQRSAEKRRQRSGMPFSSCSPRSVNAIPESAWLEVDVRSTSAAQASSVTPPPLAPRPRRA